MPVVLAQPDPFSASISAQYGATQEFNQTLPVLSSLYEQNQNRNFAASQAAIQQATQAQAQTARNREAAYQTDVQSADRFELQRRDEAMQLEVQARSQQFHAAMQDRQLTYADQIRQQERQNALTAIEEAVRNGTLTPEEAGPYALSIRTGMNAFDQQLKRQHAEEFKQQAALKSQQTANLAKDNAHMEQFEADRIKAGYGTLSFHDQNGRLHVLLKNEKTQEWYNPLLEHNKMGADQEAKQQDNEWKRFDALEKRYEDAFAKREAEVRKIHDKRMKDGTETAEPGGDQIDTEVRNDLERRGIKRPIPPAPRPSNQPTSQSAPPNTPGQEAQAQNDQQEQVPTSKVPAYDSEIEAIKSSPYNDEQKRQATGMVQGIREILAKGSKMTAEDRKNLVTFRDLLKSYQAIKWE